MDAVFWTVKLSKILRLGIVGQRDRIERLITSTSLTVYYARPSCKCMDEETSSRQVCRWDPQETDTTASKWRLMTCCRQTDCSSSGGLSAKQARGRLWKTIETVLVPWGLWAGPCDRPASLHQHSRHHYTLVPGFAGWLVFGECWLAERAAYV